MRWTHRLKSFPNPERRKIADRLMTSVSLAALAVRYDIPRREQIKRWMESPNARMARKRYR